MTDRPEVSMIRRLLPICLALLSGCAIMTDKPIEGWPDLKIAHYKVGLGEIQDLCGKHLTAMQYLISPVQVACAVVNFAKKICDIYYIADVFLPHEEDHCKGRDHNGILQAAFDKWKSTQRAHP